jgi:signal recognition particle GTPase
MADNIHPIFDQLISREEKESFLNQHSRMIWLTGLSGSGKSTIAKGLEKELFNEVSSFKFLMATTFEPAFAITWVLVRKIVPKISGELPKQRNYSSKQA